MTYKQTTRLISLVARVIHILVLFAGFPLFAQGAAFNPGDVLVGGRPAYLFSGGNAFVDKLSPVGVWQNHIAILPGSHPRDMVMINGDLIVADQQQLTAIHPDGSISVARPVYIDRYAAALTSDTTGTIYVSELEGPGIIRVPEGASTASRFVVPSSYPFIPAIDLLPDQCTLLYASGTGHIQRYNVCTGTPLADFAVMPAGIVLAIRILESGDVLVGSTAGLIRFDSAGRVLQSYANGATIMRISIVPGEARAWVAVDGPETIEQIDLSTGTVLVGTAMPTGVEAFAPEALLVVGDRRVAQSASIPTLNKVALAILGSMLLLIGVLRIMLK